MEIVLGLASEYISFLISERDRINNQLVRGQYLDLNNHKKDELYESLYKITDKLLTLECELGYDPSRIVIMIDDFRDSFKKHNDQYREGRVSNKEDFYRVHGFAVNFQTAMGLYSKRFWEES